MLLVDSPPLDWLPDERDDELGPERTATGGVESLVCSESSEPSTVTSPSSACRHVGQEDSAPTSGVAQAGQRGTGALYARGALLCAAAQALGLGPWAWAELGRASKNL